MRRGARFRRARRLRQRLRGRIRRLRIVHAELPCQLRERLRIARRQHARAFREHFAKCRGIALVQPPSQTRTRAGIAAEVSGVQRGHVLSRFAPLARLGRSRRLRLQLLQPRGFTLSGLREGLTLRICARCKRHS